MKRIETNANNEVLRYTNNAAGDLLSLTDGKSQTTRRNYDEYGRVTNKVDQAGTEIIRYNYDPEGRLTNRWSAAKGSTVYTYASIGNLTFVNYPASPDVTFGYDALNRLTNMVDAAGTTKYAYTAGDQLWTEDGPFASDTVANTYQNRLRIALALQQPTGAWTNGFGYDAGRRLTRVASAAGGFTNEYFGGVGGASGYSSALVKRLLLPNLSIITNNYDSVARMLPTHLRTSPGVLTNKHEYAYSTANQRTNETRCDGSTVAYGYDNIGQLKVADSSFNSEDRGYAYDAAWNLNYRTNNTTLYSFYPNVKNELTNAFGGDLQYDANGNLVTNAVNGFIYTYDDENRLVTWEQSGELRTVFVYDGLGRLRKRLEYVPGAFGRSLSSLATAYYVYDGNRVIQERSYANTPAVSYTRGRDLSGSLEGAGGIGGLLARSHGYSAGNWSTHNYYHADALGNITFMISGGQSLAARYRYDPYGNTISSSGSLASANVYRFSSKEYHALSGMYYYVHRWYLPSLQRWINRDPLGIRGGRISQRALRALLPIERNLYRFCENSPTAFVDSDGRSIFNIHTGSEILKKLGGGGRCCNKSGSKEWWLDNGTWKPLPPGQCTGFTDDCDGFTCSGKFYEIHNQNPAGQCGCDGNGSWLPYPPGTWGQDPNANSRLPFPPPWTPGSGQGTDPRSKGARDMPPDYPWQM